MLDLQCGNDFSSTVGCFFNLVKETAVHKLSCNTVGLNSVLHAGVSCDQTLYMTKYEGLDSLSVSEQLSFPVPFIE